MKWFLAALGIAAAVLVLAAAAALGWLVGTEGGLHWAAISPARCPRSASVRKPGTLPAAQFRPPSVPTSQPSAAVLVLAAAMPSAARNHFML